VLYGAAELMRDRQAAAPEERVGFADALFPPKAAYRLTPKR